MTTSEPNHGQSIAARIIASIADEQCSARAVDVRIGLGYTAVMLENGGVGLAYTFRELAGRGCSAWQGKLPLATKTARELVALLESSDPIAASVGLACANALSNVDDGLGVEADVLEQIELRPTDHVGMVGHFRPLVGPIRQRVERLTVFERGAQPAGAIRPSTEVETGLRDCQVALISATSIANGTIDGILDSARACREVALLGASTPLRAELFCDRNATVLSGVVVTDPAEVLRVVSEGGGTRRFRPYVRKVCMRLGDNADVT